MTLISLPDPQLSFAFEARVDVDPMVYVGGSGTDALLFFPIVGGTVRGPRLNGEIIAGGGDWASARTESVTELEARYLMRADDGAPIDIVNRGFHVASSEVMARLQAGEQVPEEEYYYRTSPIFRTDAPAHRWLTHTVFVGMARAEGAQVCLRFFALS
jgi:hypothetical protein